MSELNFDTCAGIVITLDTITQLFEESSSAGLDPESTMYQDSITGFVGAYDEGSGFEADETLEGQEAANAQCRWEYDENSIADTQKGFCCQAMDTGMGVGGLISSATKTSGETGEAVDYTMGSGEQSMTITVEYGAEAFASARGLAASLAAVASAALVFAQ